jgi:signal transduction histidine kinase
MAAVVKAMQDEAVQRERLAAVGEVVRRIAHNLRSPLAGIRGLAELSRKELDSPAVAPELRADLGENQQRIIGAVDRFELWLRDLLDATRPLEIVHQTIDPRDWLGRVIEAYRPKAQANCIDLALDTSAAPPLVAFDPRHFEHAVGALISNALDSVAAAPPAGQTAAVRVVCRALPAAASENGQLWELRVQDNGPGVPPDLRERIFTPYFTTKREGTGIGLALAQQVVRAHGGGLSLLDSPNGALRDGESASQARGAVFSARMPIGPIDVRSSMVATAGHPETASGQNSRH